jgi:hypothetical protein
MGKLGKLKNTLKILKIQYFLKTNGIKNYVIRNDLSVDVKGNVNLANKGIKKIPIQFNEVSGYFNCSNNKLKSCKGMPRKINHDFYASNNQLESLNYFPLEVLGQINLSHNKLSNLEHLPQVVHGLDVSYNQIDSLENSPEKVLGRYNISHNKLKNLKGIASYIEGRFECTHMSNLTLDYLPKHIVCDNISLDYLETQELLKLIHYQFKTIHFTLESYLAHQINIEGFNLVHDTLYSESYMIGKWESFVSYVEKYQIEKQLNSTKSENEEDKKIIKI